MADDESKYRIGQLEGDVTSLRSDVKKILENHLPHITTDIARLDVQMKIFGGLILTALSALIAMGLS